MAYVIYTKSDVSSTYKSEANKYAELALSTLTTSGSGSWQSTSSSVTYNYTAGTQDLMNQLAVVLDDYTITSVEWNVIRSWIYGQGSPMEHDYREVLTYSGSNLTTVSLYKTDLTTLVAKQDLTYGTVSGFLDTVRVRIYDTNGSTVLADYTDTLCFKNTNLLGSTVASCDDYTAFTASTATLSNDTGSKVEGTGSLKVLTTSTTGAGTYNMFSLLSATKYYFIQGYIKNGDATNGVLQVYTNGTGKTTKSSTSITATSFTQVGVVLNPSDWGTSSTTCLVSCLVTGSSKYAYFDALKVFEISSTDASLSIAELLIKYPNSFGSETTGTLLQTNRKVTI